ncbi:MAG: hypothetical protein ABIP67_13165 [Burkholderiales bacterium]
MCTRRCCATDFVRDGIEVVAGQAGGSDPHVRVGEGARGSMTDAAGRTNDKNVLVAEIVYVLPLDLFIRAAYLGDGGNASYSRELAFFR